MPFCTDDTTPTEYLQQSTGKEHTKVASAKLKLYTSQKPLQHRAQKTVLPGQELPL